MEKSEETVFVGLGSNLGNRKKNLQTARVIMGNFGFTVQEVSSILETEPVGIESKNPFLNQVIMAEVGGIKSAPEILNRLLSIEDKMGRNREKNAPDRLIDLDFLYWGQRIHESNPILPHPRLHERRFVLKPMVDLAPDFVHPLLQKTQRELLIELEKKQ